MCPLGYVPAGVQGQHPGWWGPDRGGEWEHCLDNTRTITQPQLGRRNGICVAEPLPLTHFVCPAGEHGHGWARRSRPRAQPALLCQGKLRHTPLNIRREHRERLGGAGRDRGFMLAASSLPPCGSSAAIWVRARRCLAAPAGAVGRIGAGGTDVLVSPLPARDPDSGRGGGRALAGARRDAAALRAVGVAGSCLLLRQPACSCLRPCCSEWGSLRRCGWRGVRVGAGCSIPRGWA